MSKSKIYAGLEIGTSQVRMAVGEAKSDGSLTILTIARVKSAGVRRGEITDMTLARQCVTDVWELAQQQANVDILSVYVAVTGMTVTGVNHRGTFRLPEDETIITEEHLQAVTDISEDFAIPGDHLALQRLPGSYKIDGRDHSENPLGLACRTLERDCHIIHMPSTALWNFSNCVQELPLDIDDLIFSPIASSLSFLERKDKEANCLLIDIGGGTTEYCLYWEGDIIASGCIPVGGDHVSNDIHLTTGIPLSRAERLKITEGNAFPSSGASAGLARLPAEGATQEVSIPRQVLNEIINERLVETLKMVQSKLPTKARTNLRGGVFLCGGSSLLRGIPELIMDIFQSPVYLKGLDETEDEQVISEGAYWDDPTLQGVIGLLRYAQYKEFEDKKKKKTLFDNLFGWFKS